MRIGPFELRRTTTAAAPAQTAKEIGASGTINQSGYLVDDEYNSDLRGRQGLDAFRRMVDSDGAVREAWLHIRAPLLNADWDIDAASDDPVHLEQAEFIRRALFDFPSMSFRQVLPTALKYLTQGFQLYELPETVVTAELTWDDPNTQDPVSSGRRDFVVWEHFAHRKPETVWKWNAHAGRLLSVVQYAFKDGTFGEFEIPADQLLVLVNDREGDDFTGQSILRAAYKAWYLKELIEKINAIAVERHGVGINVVYVPKSSANDEEMIARLEQMLQDLSAGERPYLIIPGPKGQASGGDMEGGFYFEVVTPGSQAADNTTFMTYLRGEIKGSMLVRFSELGHGQTGARATGDVQAKVWYDVLHAIAYHLGDSLRPYFRRLLEKNYAQVDELPELVARNIDARSLAEFADAVSKLAVADMILPDKSARNVARAAAGMPDEDEDAEEQVARLKNAGMPIAQPGGIEEDPPPPAPTQEQRMQTHLRLLEQRLTAAVSAHAADVDSQIQTLTADNGADETLRLALEQQAETVRAALAAIPEAIGHLPAPTVTLDPGAIQVEVQSQPNELHLTLASPRGAEKHELVFDPQTGKVTGSVVTPIQEEETADG